MDVERKLVEFGYADDSVPIMIPTEALALQVDVYQAWLKAALTSIGLGGADEKYRKRVEEMTLEILARCQLLLAKIKQAV
jgi:hypothetical protein